MLKFQSRTKISVKCHWNPFQKVDHWHKRARETFFQYTGARMSLLCRENNKNRFDFFDSFNVFFFFLSFDGFAGAHAISLSFKRFAFILKERKKKKPRGFQMEKVGNALYAGKLFLHCIIRCASSYFKRWLMVTSYAWLLFNDELFKVNFMCLHIQFYHFLLITKLLKRSSGKGNWAMWIWHLFYAVEKKEIERKWGNWIRIFAFVMREKEEKSQFWMW